MTEQENSELIEVVLGLLEKSKQQDESMQKAIQAIESEKDALEALRKAVGTAALGGVALGVKNAIETQNKAIDEQVSRISSATGNLVGSLNKARKEFTWQNFAWQYGSFVLFIVSMGAFLFWFIPDLDEIRERKSYLEALDRRIESRSELEQLKTTRCDGKLCVRVNAKQCGYTVKNGNNSGSYCIIQ